MADGFSFHYILRFLATYLETSRRIHNFRQVPSQSEQLCQKLARIRIKESLHRQATIFLTSGVNSS